MHGIGRSLHFSSIPTLPVFENVKLFDSAETNNRFSLSAGGPGCANFRTERGGLVPPVTNAWLRQSVTHAIMLRGLHSQTNWETEGFTWDASGSESDHYQRQFIAVVNACLLGEDPKRPSGTQKGKDVLHAWSRACIDDVIVAAGSHMSTRRYIYDHVHYWDGGVLKTNMVSDEFTPSFGYGGDWCVRPSSNSPASEDSNTPVKWIIEYVLRQVFTDPLLLAVQACLTVAGVPCVVAGTARSASAAVNNECSAGHVFGFSVPHRIMARLLWGGSASAEDILAEVNFYLKSKGHKQGVSAWVLQCIQPHLFETIMRTPPGYVDRDVIKQDNDLQRFEVFLAACREMDVDPIVAEYVMSPYPLSLPHKDEHRATKHRHG